VGGLDGGNQVVGCLDLLKMRGLVLPERKEGVGVLVMRRGEGGVLAGMEGEVLPMWRGAGNDLPKKKVEGVVEYSVGGGSWWVEGFDWLFLPKLWLRPLRPSQSPRDLSVGF